MPRTARSGHVLRSATFGCVPVSDDVGTRAYLNDLCVAITEGIGLEVRPHRAPSPSALASAFAHERVHLAWVSPVLVIMDPGLADAVPLVHSVRHGMIRYHSVIFTRAESALSSISDLRGASMAWVAPTSAGGYVFARMALESAGIPLSALGPQRMLGSHGSVVEAVQSGAADAGATFAIFEEGDPARPLVRSGYASEEQPKDGFRVLAVSDSIPSDIIVASPTLLSTLSVDIAAALEALGKNESAANAMRRVLGADSFERCVSTELDGLRFRLRALLAAAG